MTKQLVSVIRDVAYIVAPSDETRNWWVLETSIYTDGSTKIKLLYGPYLFQDEAERALSYA